MDEEKKYQIPDFLKRPVPPEVEKEADRRMDLEKQYWSLFPDSGISMHCISEGLNPDEAGWKRFYDNMADCIRKKQKLEDLYPEWDIWDPDSDDEV